jgi:acetyltransferase-like isoleucine patch superfamily enzyme
MTRVFVYGSLVGREVFERLDPGQFVLSQFVARQSILSGYSRPVTLLPPPPLESRFQQRMIRGDFESDLQNVLAASAEETDLVLLDLNDECLGAFLLPDGSVITRTPDLVSSGTEQHLPEGSHYLALGDQLHFEYWSTAVEWLGDLLRRYVPRARVVLIDIPWAERTDDGQLTPPIFGMSAWDANAALRPYVEQAARALAAEVVTLPAHQVAAASSSPWGVSPIHYGEPVWQAVATSVTKGQDSSSWTAHAEAPPSRQAVAGRVTGGTASHASAAITPEGLVDATWRFRRVDGSHAVEPVRLLHDGRLWGHSHKNESSWSIEDGHLVFKAANGKVSTRFDQVERTAEGLRFTGAYVLNPKANVTHVLETIELDWENRPRYPRQTRNLLKDEIKKFGWEIGDHTYGKPVVRESGRAPLTIGKFCSIGDNVTLILGNHRIDAVSTYPFKTLSAYWPNGARVSSDHDSHGPITIGNDVWIGEGAIIVSGTTIGDGAVIAAGAVVSGDVEPYAVVAGVPARPVQKRFTDQQIRSLLALQWWNWPDERIDALLPLMAEDVDFFLDAVTRP